jgi:hypothetical protein
MIIILAVAADTSARAVERWLSRWRIPNLLIEDDDPVVEIEAHITGHAEDAFVRTLSGREFRLSQVRACWFRRGRLAPAPCASSPHDDRRYWERKALTDWVMERLESGPGLGSAESERRCTKLVALSVARAVGLTIPETFITGERRRLCELLGGDLPAVTKGIEAGAPFEEDDDLYAGSTTRRLGADDAEYAPATFSPRLVQRWVDKVMELRIFVLGGALTAMALVPLDPNRLLIDARQHLTEDAYNLVPYTLPDAIARRIHALMERLRLDTGSVDMLVSKTGTHVFLEVNPTGQFEWLSRACNAGLERKIAEHLARAADASPNTASPGAGDGRWRGAERSAPLADAPDDDFTSARHRVTRADGSLTLVRPLYKPVLRRFAGPPSASVGAAGAESPAPAPAVGVSDEQHVLLAANCTLVVGVNEALIYDFQRHTALRVPAVLRGILGAPRGTSVGELKAAGVAASIDSAIAAGLRAGVLHLVDAPGSFPVRPLAWDPSGEITNAVLDVGEVPSYDLLACLDELLALGCEHALIRCTAADPLAVIERVMAELSRRPPLFVEWWIRQPPACSPTQLAAVCGRHARITAILVFEATTDDVWLRTRSGIGNILALTTAMPADDAAPAGIEALTVDADLHAESLQANSFFNRKLAITRDGAVKNGPGASECFGTAGDRPLREIVATPAFRRLWTVRKDMIEGCRDCAYRHACVDPREPLALPDGSYRHGTRCPLQPPDP